MSEHLPLIVQKSRETGVSIEAMMGGLSRREQMAILNSWDLWRLP